MAFFIHKHWNLGSGKLKALLEVKVREVGRRKAARQLLAACRTIPQPIIQAVMDQLACDHTNYIVISILYLHIISSKYWRCCILRNTKKIGLSN